jgi:hypothetical protein
MPIVVTTQRARPALGAERGNLTRRACTTTRLPLHPSKARPLRLVIAAEPDVASSTSRKQPDVVRLPELSNFGCLPGRAGGTLAVR